MLGAPASGSITQWIAVCSCASRAVVETDELESTKTRICGKCGKRLNTGRSGSLTQWVFRQDLCACEVPEPIETTGSFNPLRDSADATAQSSLLSFVFTGDRAQGIEEVAMDVDPDKFPLDRYVPIFEIGKGGSGTVYYCRDRILDKIVAVKTLHALSAHQLLSFQNEARATSRLNHPNVIKVLDFGATAAGVPFMSMEFVDGISMEHLIAQGKMFSVDEAIELFCDVGRGLMHAHAAGILHRDIKNSNLLIYELPSGAPAVCIIDFGVAVLRSGVGEQGKTIVGTPRYMPPDLARGEEYDERSEVYEFGCTLFEALTGDTPFLSEIALDLIRQHAEEEPPRLSERSPVAFSEALEELVSKCLEKRKDDRFQSMSELVSALEELRPRVPHIVDEPPRAFESVAKTGSYVLITALLVSGVVAVANLGLGVFHRSEKLAEVKVPSVADHQPFGPILVDAASESLRPRFEDRMRHDEKWTISKGNVTNDSLVELARRKDIKRLSLMGDVVDGRGLCFLLELPLEALDMDGTVLRDKDVDVLRRFDRLEFLGVANTKMTTKGLARLNELPALRHLTVGGKDFDDTGLEVVSHIGGLTEVSIRATRCVTASGIARLAAIPNLSCVSFKDVNTRAALLAGLAKLPRLTELHIYEVNLEPDAFQALKKLRLNELRLRRCRVSDAHLEELSAFKTLRVLNLEGTFGFSEAGLEAFRRKVPRCKIE